MINKISLNRTKVFLNQCLDLNSHHKNKTKWGGGCLCLHAKVSIMGRIGLSPQFNLSIRMLAIPLLIQADFPLRASILLVMISYSLRLSM